MASIYPAAPDVFLPWINGVTDMVAADIEDLFDAILQVEQELGDAQEDPQNRPWPPSGDFGSITGRLFARGMLSGVDGGYVPLWYYVLSNVNAASFVETGGGSGSIWPPERYEGRDLGWGEGFPVAFAALQGPFTGSFTLGGLDHWAKGRPWGLVCVRQDERGASLWIGRDGGNGVGQMGALNPGSPVTVRNDCIMAFVMWGMRT